MHRKGCNGRKGKTKKNNKKIFAKWKWRLDSSRRHFFSCSYSRVFALIRG